MRKLIVIAAFALAGCLPEDEQCRVGKDGEVIYHVKVQARYSSVPQWTYFDKDGYEIARVDSLRCRPMTTKERDDAVKIIMASRGASIHE
jgi:hypothetical protein